MVRIALILFIISMIFMIIGYSFHVSPSKGFNREIEFVPRSVYDEIVMSTSLK